MPEILTGHSLQALNSFKLRVRAKYYVACRSVGEITDFATSGKAVPPVLLLGEGSNLLFSGDFPGTVLHPGIPGIEVTGETAGHTTIRAGAGVHWDDLVDWTVQKGLWGLENLSLIPGSAGAAPVQNIGAYGAELREHLVSVGTVDLRTGRERTFSNRECRFAYRYSIFKEQEFSNFVISTIDMKLSRNPAPRLEYGKLTEELEASGGKGLQAIREAVIRIRRSKLPDPAVIGNAGSFFKNPVLSEAMFTKLQARYPDIPSFPAGKGQRKIPAAWLLEKTGWKGKRIGNAGCYEHQPLVIVNHGGATGREILELSEKMAGEVFRFSGIRLEREVRLV